MATFDQTDQKRGRRQPVVGMRRHLLEEKYFDTHSADGSEQQGECDRRSLSEEKFRKCIETTE